MKVLSIRLTVALLFIVPLAASAQGAGRADSISLNSVTLDTTKALPDVPETLRAETDEVLLVKFPGPVTADQLRGLKAATERVYTYLPHFAFLVRMPPETPEKSSRLAGLGAVWSGPYHPLYKISRAIAGIEAGRLPLKAREEKLSVLLQVYPDADLGRLRRSLAELGVRDVAGAKAKERFSRVRLLLDREEIVRLREGMARLPEVFWIELEGRRVLHNDTSIWVGQSGVGGGGATPVFDAGIYGEGQVVGIIDTGIDPDMCFFRDGSLGFPPMNLCDGGTATDYAQRKVVAVDFLWSNDCSGGVSNTEWDNHDHGSHVAGSVAGDNLANLLFHDTGDGMAPGAKLVIQDGGFSTGDNCADLPGLGCPVVDLVPIFQQAYDQGARIHTNSWGDRENFTPYNLYSAGSEDVDQIMWTHKDFLILSSAGNNGNSSGTVASPSTAKSILSVGATQRGSSADSLASFSSCGPTDDGRIKPDLMAPGVSIVSADNDGNAASNNCGTRTMSGTSMSSPTAAGYAALVRQYFTDGFYPTGAANAPDAMTPSSALVKATLINSSREMANVAAIPSNCQGWGRVLLDDALHFPGDGRALWVHDEATGFGPGSSGETFVWAFTVNSSTEDFKATLAWTDYPSTPAANPHINNDLDLEVTGPGGTYLGNVFSAGESTTTGSADRLNTLEQVLIKSPATGSYTVTVRSFNVPDGPQDFALVLSGDVTESAPCQSTCGNNTIECNELCDGTDLGGATCAGEGCSGGTLACNVTCDGYDTSACTGCPVCDGDGVCEAGEDCFGCPNDCASGSTPGASCGNGLCEAGDGEDCVSCPADCNGVQGGKPSNRFCCGDGDGQNPLPCSDPSCSTGGWSCTDTPTVPGSFCCGQFGCESGESCSNCALDCTTGAEICDDGLDNDCNGLTDCDDGACVADPQCIVAGCGVGFPSCCAKGDSCTQHADCCSGNCKGNGTCR